MNFVCVCVCVSERERERERERETAAEEAQTYEKLSMYAELQIQEMRQDATLSC